MKDINLNKGQLGVLRPGGGGGGGGGRGFTGKLCFSFLCLGLIRGN